MDRRHQGKELRFRGKPSLIFTKRRCCRGSASEMGASSAIDHPPTGWGFGPAGVFSAPGARGRSCHLEVIKPLSGASDVTSCEGCSGFGPLLGLRSEGRVAPWSGHGHVEVTWQLWPRQEAAVRPVPAWPSATHTFSVPSFRCLFTHFVTSDPNNLPLYFFPNFLFLLFQVSSEICVCMS